MKATWSPNEEEDQIMGLKVLGLLCAGVFVGAALMEVRQLGWGKKRKKGDDDSCGNCDEADAAPAPAKDVDGAVTDKA